MKRIISTLLTAFLLTGTIFAEKKYSGDVQILGGLSIDDYQIKKEGTLYADSLLFDLSVESWHFFKINSVLDAGFMAGINAGIGGTTLYKINSYSVPQDSLGVAYHVNAITGPAIALSVKDVVRFNIAVGLDVSYLNLISYTESDDPVVNYCTPLGFALEAQAKFTPNKKVSPIVGYRITTNFGNEFANLSNGTNTPVQVDSLAVVTNTIFAGISFNW